MRLILVLKVWLSHLVKQRNCFIDIEYGYIHLVIFNCDGRNSTEKTAVTITDTVTLATAIERGQVGGYPSRLFHPR